MHRICIMIVSMLIAPNIAFTAAPINYADIWKTWSVVSRGAYIYGVTEGIAEAYIETVTAIAPSISAKKPEPPEITKVRERLFVRDTRNQICDVITDLYQDPANAFVIPLDMFFLARDKIEGKDISKSMMEARKKALEIHKLNEEMKTK
jgi:hypothetical protein